MPATATIATELFISANGTPIGSRRTGSGPPFVLVHGSAADGGRWAPIVPALSERFTVYAVDRAGRGISGDHEPYSIEREYEDVAAVVDALPEPAVVLGHSYGALCMLDGVRRASNVAGMVLYEPPLPAGFEIYEPGLIARLEELVAAGKRDEALATFMREVPRVPEAHIEVMRGQETWVGRVAAAHTLARELRAVNELEGDIREQYADVEIPTLLLIGGASPSFLVEPSRALAQTLPNVDVAWFDGHAHSAMDTATGDFVERVLAFAAGL